MGHKQDSQGKTVRYTVWNNHTDKLVALDETGPNCAALMGITYASFLSFVSRGSRKWTIEKRYSDELESEDEE